MVSATTTEEVEKKLAELREFLDQKKVQIIYDVDNDQALLVPSRYTVVSDLEQQDTVVSPDDERPISIPVEPYIEGLNYIIKGE